MVTFPKELIPVREESVTVPSGTIVRLPKTTPRFIEWRQPVPFDRYGKKAVLDFGGEPVFAELAILRAFEAEGWSGVWVDTYRRSFRRDVLSAISIPVERQRLLDRIYEVAGARGGCFDVFVWKADVAIFAESKRRGRDQIRRSQLRWIDAALRCGVTADSLLLVEWESEKRPNPESSVSAEPETGHLLNKPESKDAPR